MSDVFTLSLSGIVSISTRIGGHESSPQATRFQRPDGDIERSQVERRGAGVGGTAYAMNLRNGGIDCGRQNQ